MKNELKNYSANVRRCAKKIMSEARVNNILKKYGRVLISGSLELDLMYDPDIDIVVECDNPEEVSKLVLNEFIDQRYFQKVEYGDFVTYPRENRPEGHIVNLRKEYDGMKWEVEIWFLNSIKTDEMFMHKMKLKLNEDTRMKIMQKKKERADSGKTKHDLSSFEIYQQVLGV